MPSGAPWHVPTPAEREAQGIARTANWIATCAGLLGVLAVMWPEAARPLISVLAAGVLVTLAIGAIVLLARRLPRPAKASAFNERRRRTTDMLPSELLRITNGMVGTRLHKPVPDPTYWTLRRIASDRVALRHGRRLRDGEDASWLVPHVSADLFRVLTLDSDRNTVLGNALPSLIAEVENM